MLLLVIMTIYTIYYVLYTIPTKNLDLHCIIVGRYNIPALTTHTINVH